MRTTLSGKTVGALWLSLAVGAAVLVAGGFSFLVAAIPWSTEVWLAHRLPSLPVSECRAPIALTRLRERLFPVFDSDRKFQVQLHLVNANDVNAFASLGGDIFVNSALIAEALTGDEVAGVLAHEITHVENRDVLQGLFGRLLIAAIFSGDSGWMPGGLNQIMNMKFTNAQEEAADRGAMLRLKKAQIAPSGLADFFSRLPSGAILSDHPDSARRAELARETIVENPRSALDETDWRELKKAAAACH